MIQSGLLGFAVSAVVVRLVMIPTIAGMFLDRPNERSLHASPIPRTGGLGVMSGVCGVLAALVPGVAVLLACVLALAAISLVDDWRSLPAWLRLTVHLAVSTAFLIATGVDRSPLALLGFILAIVWMTNLYNFMDGMDGLAGSMTLIGFATYALAATLGGHTLLAVACLTVAAAAGGFLLWNFPPARVFMGDVGSVPLGFLAAALGITGWHLGAWPLGFPVLVFGPFIVDATVTLLRRALRREKIWQAHRSHYYQRLVLMGFSHRQTLLWECALMTVSSSAALLALGCGALGQLLVATGLTALYVAVMHAIDRRCVR